MTAAIAKVVEARAGWVTGANVKVPPGAGRAQADHRGGVPDRPGHADPGHVEDVVPRERPQLLRGEHLDPGQDHRRHRAAPRPEVRVVERGRAGHAVTRVRSRRVHRRQPHGADRRPRRRHVLELDDAVQRGPARRPADGRPLESQVLHLPLPARPRRDGVEDARRRQPDHVVHQRHEAPGRDPDVPLHARAAGAGSATRSGASRTAARSASASRPSRTSSRRRPRRSS